MAKHREAIAIVILLVISILQTKYFGWNLAPQSDAELVTDIILISAAAIIYGLGGD